MKIFELTEKKLIENPLLDKLKTTLDAAVAKKNSQSNTSSTGDITSGQGKLRFLAKQYDAVRNGEAKLSKDIDKAIASGDANKAHGDIFNLIQDATSTLAKQTNTRRNRSSIDTQLTSAVYGYINNKYLGGSKDNFKGNTKDLVAQAVAKAGPKGGQMPVGRVSSSRPAGQRGTVQAGDETNALDTMAARNADW